MRSFCCQRRHAQTYEEERVEVQTQQANLNRIESMDGRVYGLGFRGLGFRVV